MSPLNQPDKVKSAATDKFQPKHSFRVLLLQIITCFSVFLVAGWLIYTLFGNQWLNVVDVVYGQPNASPLITTTVPEATSTLVVTVPPPTSEATISASFVNDLIQAILDASNSAQATAEVMELLTEEF